jgi:hypothetical protein
LIRKIIDIDAAIFGTMTFLVERDLLLSEIKYIRAWKTLTCSVRSASRSFSLTDILSFEKAVDGVYFNHNKSLLIACIRSSSLTINPRITSPESRGVMRIVTQSGYQEPLIEVTARFEMKSQD